MMNGVERALARHEVRERIERVLSDWEKQ